MHIDTHILLGRMRPELFNEPEKESAWLARLPSLSEILPASLKVLNLMSKEISLGDHTLDERFSAVRPWSIKIAEHFEKHYTKTPNLSKIYYCVYDRELGGLSPEDIPENVRIDRALAQHHVKRVPSIYSGEIFMCTWPTRYIWRRITSPFSSKITSANST